MRETTGSGAGGRKQLEFCAKAGESPYNFEFPHWKVSRTGNVQTVRRMGNHPQSLKIFDNR